MFTKDHKLIFINPITIVMMIAKLIKFMIKKHRLNKKNSTRETHTGTLFSYKFTLIDLYIYIYIYIYILSLRKTTNQSHKFIILM